MSCDHTQSSSRVWNNNNNNNNNNNTTPLSQVCRCRVNLLRNLSRRHVWCLRCWQWLRAAESCRSTVDGVSSVHRRSGGSCRYATEPGTHSVKLCFIGLVIDVPVVVQCSVHSSRSSWSSTSLSWRRGRFLWSRAADHRDFPIAVIDTVVSCVVPVPQFVRSCTETVEIPQLQPVFLDPVVHTPVVCNDSCLVDVLAQFIDGSHVPVIMQRRLLSGSAPVSVFAVDGGHFSCATEKGTRLTALLFMVAAKGFFDACCVIFRAPPVVPELSASFPSFRAPTTVSG